MKSTFFPASALRVKISTSRKSNETIEKQMIENVAKYLNAGKEDISKRIEQLNKEWDTERVLEANASAIIFIGTVLGFLVNVWFFLICGFISFYLLMHALEGRCPPLPLIRKLGVRTVYEICTGKMILKHLRGDFKDTSLNATELIEAAKIESSMGK
jgi:hypothetical protein